MCSPGAMHHADTRPLIRSFGKLRTTLSREIGPPDQFLFLDSPLAGEKEFQPLTIAAHSKEALGRFQSRAPRFVRCLQRRGSALNPSCTSDPRQIKARDRPSLAQSGSCAQALHRAPNLAKTPLMDRKRVDAMARRFGFAGNAAFVAVFASLILLCVAPAHAQNLSLRAPGWAEPLVGADLAPTTGGRLNLNDPNLELAVRVAIAPNQGGVARVIRFEKQGDRGLLALRRFTGHPNAGWWMWGPDTPYNRLVSPADQQRIAAALRSAIGAGGALGGDLSANCPAGEQAFVEMASGGRAITASRTCVGATDSLGRLVTLLSQLAGSETEEALHREAAEELMGVDRAFSEEAQRIGIAAAMAAYAAQDAITFREGAANVGPEEAARNFADMPEGGTLVWAPETARVSERGDMGWTWGRATFTPPNAQAVRMCYVTIWTRDFDGAWKFAFDSGLTRACVE